MIDDRHAERLGLARERAPDPAHAEDGERFPGRVAAEPGRGVAAEGTRGRAQGEERGGEAAQGAEEEEEGGVCGRGDGRGGRVGDLDGVGGAVCRVDSGFSRGRVRGVAFGGMGVDERRERERERAWRGGCS